MKKRLLALAAAVTLLVSGLAIPASASSTDTDYTLSFHFITGQAETKGRIKEDASSSYIYAKQLPNGGFQVFIDGSNIKDDPNSYDNCTKNTAYLTVVSKGRLIRQYVKEDGFKFARLGGYKHGASKAAIGVWSPDSTGSYTYLN